MALIIQCHKHGWFARRVARHLRKMQAERLSFQAEEREREAREEEVSRKKAIERRMKPRNQSDFEILYGELEAWRLQETQKIQEAGLHPEEQHLGLQQLLHKETKLLQTIDRLKISANADNRAGRIRTFLKDMSVPKRPPGTIGTTSIEPPAFRPRSGNGRTSRAARRSVARCSKMLRGT